MTDTFVRTTLSPALGSALPLTRAEYIAGVFATVADHAARDAIPAPILRLGTLIRTLNDNVTWEVTSVGPVVFSPWAPGTVISVFGRHGTVVSVAGDYTSTQITNLSTATGATVTDALNSIVSLVGTPGGSVGQALIWNGTSYQPGTDFAAQVLKTTGAIALGTGSLPTTGDIRLAHGTKIRGSWSGGGPESDLLDWGITGGNTLTVGSISTNLGALNLYSSGTVGLTVSPASVNAFVQLNTLRLLVGYGDVWFYTGGHIQPQVLSSPTGTGLANPLILNGQSWNGLTSGTVFGGDGTLSGGAVTGTGGTRNGGNAYLYGGPGDTTNGNAGIKDPSNTTWLLQLNQTATDFISMGPTPVASTGAVRLSSSSATSYSGVYARNTFNTQNIQLVAYDSGNGSINVNTGVGQVNNTIVNAAGLLQLTVNSLPALNLTTTALKSYITFSFKNGAVSPLINSEDLPGPVTTLTGQLLTVAGQNVTGVASAITATAGSVGIVGGSSTGAAGTLVGGNAFLQAGAGGTTPGHVGFKDDAGVYLLDWNKTTALVLTVGNTARNTVINGVTSVKTNIGGTTQFQIDASFATAHVDVVFTKTTPFIFPTTDGSSTSGTGTLLSVVGQQMTAAAGTTTGGSVCIAGGAVSGPSGTRTGGNGYVRGGVGSSANGFGGVRNPADNTWLLQLNQTTADFVQFGPAVATAGAIRLSVGSTIQAAGNLSINPLQVYANLGTGGNNTIEFGDIQNDTTTIRGAQVALRNAGGISVTVLNGTAPSTIYATATLFANNSDGSGSVADWTIRARNNLSGAGASLIVQGGSGTTTAGNVALGLAPASWNAMGRGVFVSEAGAIPTGNPASGCYLYQDPADHKLKLWEQSGLVTVLDAAGTGAVSSVFGRGGAVVATAGDYTSTQITNSSGVTGTTVTAALNTLNGALATAGPIVSVFSRTGTIVATAGDYTSTQITNSSGVTGSTVTAALNTLNAALATAGPISSVFTRTGAIVSAVGDYTDAQITNTSTVSGAHVNNALTNLNTMISAFVTGVSSVFGRGGAVVATAGDYTSTKITNSSSVTGSTSTDALNALLLEYPNGTYLKIASFTLDNANFGQLGAMNGAGILVTIPTMSSSGIVQGAKFPLLLYGATATLSGIVGASGVTVHIPAIFPTSQWTLFELECIGGDVWRVTATTNTPETSGVLNDSTVTGFTATDALNTLNKHSFTGWINVPLNFVITSSSPYNPMNFGATSFTDGWTTFSGSGAYFTCNLPGLPDGLTIDQVDLNFSPKAGIHGGSLPGSVPSFVLYKQVAGSVPTVVTSVSDPSTGANYETPHVISTGAITPISTTNTTFYVYFEAEHGANSFAGAMLSSIRVHIPG